MTPHDHRADSADDQVEPLDESATNLLGELSGQIAITRATIAAGALTRVVVAGLEDAARNAIGVSLHLARETEAEAEAVRQAAGEALSKLAGPDEAFRATARRDLCEVIVGTVADDVEHSGQAARLAAELERAVHGLREYAAGLITETLPDDALARIAQALDTAAASVRHRLVGAAEHVVIEDDRKP
jgi:hypothetical protein